MAWRASSVALARGLPRPALGLQCWLVLPGRDCLRLSALSLHAFGDITAKKVLPGGAASAWPWLCCSGWDTQRGAGGGGGTCVLATAFRPAWALGTRGA